VVVNKAWQRYTGQGIVLPPYGFVIQSPAFQAFHAFSWNGLSYEKPVLFTLRSLDGKPIASSSQVRIYHAFGDERIRGGKKVFEVKKEAVVAP